MTDKVKSEDFIKAFGSGVKQMENVKPNEYSVKEKKIMTDKIKQAVADEFKYRASQGRTNYSMEEVIYIVNEVIDEVAFEALEEKAKDCETCKHNGEKPVTGNCIKCRDFDRYER